MKNGDFGFFIFDNGIQIIAENVCENSETVRLLYPFQLTMMTTERGPTPMLIPFLQNTDELEMVIRKDKIFTFYIPNNPLLQSYKDSVEKFRASKSRIVPATGHHLKVINEHNLG